MIVISDIDGTVCLSIFKNDGSQDQHSSGFQKALFDVPIMAWVINVIKVFQQARAVIFITGRGVHLNTITTMWVSKNLGINDFRIVNVGFENYQQYLTDKKARLDDAITECVACRLAPLEMIHVLEDDPAILDWLVAKAPELDAFMVHAIKDGKHRIAFPISKHQTRQS